MLIRSGSILLPLAYLATVVVVIGLLTSIGIRLFGRRREGTRVAVASLATFGVAYLLISVISWLAPQRVIARGDSYCWDLWCMGINDVTATRRGPEVVYRIGVRVFSDANSVRTSTDGARIYLVDDAGRRFSAVDDPGVIPISTSLEPGQSFETALTFVTPPDARRLYLTGDASLPDPLPLAWRFFKIYADPHIGYEKILHEPTLMRVL